MSLYCDEIDVKNILPKNIVFQGDNPSPNFFNPEPENLPQLELDYFISEASDFIDGELGTVYDVPLHKVNQAGIVDYPKPIRRICAILAADRAYSKLLKGADRQVSEEIKANIEYARNCLRDIKDGQIHIVGHEPFKSGRFVRNTLYNAPINPASKESTRPNR